MKKETNLCMSCMVSKSSPGECQHCGWVDKGVHLASYLYPKTFLAGRYIAGKLISYNGEAALYVGYDTLTEAKITIKEYMPDALCTRARDALPLSVNLGELPLYKTYLSEFVELNRSLQSLSSSPGIQRVTDVFSENNTAYAIYENVPGISIQTYLANVGGILSPAQVREIFPVVFTALGRVNTAGIVHRGISPKTVFVENIENAGNSRLVPYIANFAITAARIYGSKINSEVFAGFAAPEQYNATDRHGNWTDIYSLAALLYNVMTGIVPQDAPSRLKDDKLVEPILVNRDIPANISKTIMDAMVLSADKRIQNVGEFSRLLWGQSAAVLSQTQVIPSANNGVVSAIPSHTTPVTQSFPSIGTGVPVRPDVQIEFEEDEANSDEEQAELSRQERKAAIEKKKKRRLIIALATISVLVVVFLILLILAITTDIFEREPPEPPPTPETTEESSATEPPVTEEPPSAQVYRQVANFVGRNYETVRDGDSVFELIFEPYYNPDYPYGTIFEQSIEAGEEVPVETEITLRYSLGPEWIQIPAIGQITVDNFRNVLIERGVNAANIQVADRVIDEYIPGMAGMVVAVNPESWVRVVSFPGDDQRRAQIVTIFRAVLPEPPPETEPITEPAPEPEP